MDLQIRDKEHESTNVSALHRSIFAYKLIDAGTPALIGCGLDGPYGEIFIDFPLISKETVRLPSIGETTVTVPVATWSVAWSLIGEFRMIGAAKLKFELCAKAIDPDIETIKHRLRINL